MPAEQTIGHYRIVGSLGEGGMGTVYVAHDEKLKRRVAIKSIRSDHRLDPIAKQRFLREAQILSSLDHPNICRIYDYIEAEENDFLVLELIDGEPLEAARSRISDRASGLRLAEQLARVLVAAHAEGIVHRDLKPENIMLTSTGDIKVLDFGLAQSGHHSREATAEPVERPPRSEDDPEQTLSYSQLDHLPTELQGEHFRTGAGRITGTPMFMSPEQARGETVTAASDMYSCGLVLRYLFSGQLPYEQGLDLKTILGRAARGEKRPLTGVRGELKALIESLESPAPADRPTAVQLLERLQWIRAKPRRRMRRLAVAAALLLIALAILKYTIDLNRERDIAVEAQNEATRRRAQAEDLISFMLGDLRQRLEPVGRLDVLDAVGDKALDYFASLSESELDDDELFRRSTALRQIGEVRLAGNDLPAASRAFEESLSLARGLVQRDVTDSDWLLGLGASHFWLGNISWLQRDLDRALEHFEAYKDTADRLIAVEPTEPTSLLELSYAQTNLGAVYQEQGRFELALPAIEDSVRIKQELLSMDPSNTDYDQSLANGLSWLASVKMQHGDLEGALATFQTELERREAIQARDPRDMEARYLLAICLSQIGNLQMFLGNVKEATARYVEMQTIAREIVTHDPTNKDWDRELAISHTYLGRAQAAAGKDERAAPHFQTCDLMLREMVEDDPSNTERRLDWAMCLSGRSATALSSGDSTRALEYALSSVDQVESIEQEEAGGRYFVEARATAGLHLARALAAHGNASDAQSVCRRELEAIEASETTGMHPRIRALQAMILLCLEAGDQAQPIIDELEEYGYRHPDFVASVGDSTSL